MISRVRGVARQWNPETESVEVDVGGIWYEVLLPTYCWRALEARPEQVDLLIHYHVPDRHPTPMLIGFLRPVERSFFKKFMQVRRMGAANARRALATSVSTIARWIEAEDKAALQQLPGVGARQAEQIVAELKGKVVEEAMLRDEGYTALPVEPAPAMDRALDEAAAALVGLGYSRREAREWVGRVASDGVAPEAEAVLRAVFQGMAGDH